MTNPDEESSLSEPKRRAWLDSDERSVVYRQGDVVLRETGPWSPTVHALLKHLESVGFEATPKVVGTGFAPDGREILNFIDGEVVNPKPWSIEAITVSFSRVSPSSNGAASSYLTESPTCTLVCEQAARTTRIKGGIRRDNIARHPSRTVHRGSYRKPVPRTSTMTFPFVPTPM